MRTPFIRVPFVAPMSRSRKRIAPLASSVIRRISACRRERGLKELSLEVGTARATECSDEPSVSELLLELARPSTVHGFESTIRVGVILASEGATKSRTGQAKVILKKFQFSSVTPRSPG